MMRRGICSGRRSLVGLLGTKQNLGRFWIPTAMHFDMALRARTAGSRTRPGNPGGVAEVLDPHRLGGSRAGSCWNFNVLRLFHHGACSPFPQSQHTYRPERDFRDCRFGPLLHLDQIAPDARPLVATARYAGARFRMTVPAVEVVGYIAAALRQKWPSGTSLITSDLPMLRSHQPEAAE